MDRCFSEVGALDTDKLSDVLDSEQLKTALTWLRHYNYPHDAVEVKQRIEKIIGWFAQLNKMSYDALFIKNRVSKGISLPDSRKKDLLDNAFFLKDLVDKDLFNDIPEMAGELRRVAKLLKEDQKPAETEQKAKRIIAAIVISLIVIVLFELLVYRVPIGWLKNHPNSYGLQGGIVLLILSSIFVLFKPAWRKWYWKTALLALVVLILSLLGGRSSR